MLWINGRAPEYALKMGGRDGIRCVPAWAWPWGAVREVERAVEREAREARVG